MAEERLTGKGCEFPARVRVKRRKDFVCIQQQGNRVPGRYCTILFLPNELSHPRLGITITKKVHKRAVVRNHFKRRIREMFRTECGHMDAGLDMVVIARNSAVGVDYDSLKKDFLKSWNKALKMLRKTDQEQTFRCRK